MSDILLQTIVDKLEALESILTTSKPQIIEADNGSLQECIKQQTIEVSTKINALSETLTFPKETISQLTQRLQSLSVSLKQPLRKEIRHEHHINTGIIVCICLVVILACCGCWIYNLHNDTKAYKANDIKYRYVKMNIDNVHLLSKVDSLYNVAGDQMIQEVKKQETDLRKRLDLLQKADMKEKEAKRLRDEAGNNKR